MGKVLSSLKKELEFLVSLKGKIKFCFKVVIDTYKNEYAPEVMQSGFLLELFPK